MSKSISCAIIGCGRIAGHNARAIVDTKGLELVAVSDLIEEKSKVYADEFSVPTYQNYHKMIEMHPEIDLVVVATPSGMHYEHAMDMLDHGKSVVIEKPTFIKPSQLVAAYKKANEKGLRIFPIFQNRYNSAVKHVKQALVNGDLGDVRIVSVRVRWCRPQSYYNLSAWRGTYAQDGGALTNQGIHHIDLLRYLVGDLQSVHATMRTMGADIEVEDTIVATMKYKNGAVGNLEITTAARPDNYEASISIVGSKGLAQIGGIAVNELQIFTPDPSACDKQSEDFSGCVYGNGHKVLFESIEQSMREDCSYLIGKDDCFNTINLLHAFYCSDEQSVEVKISSNLESTRLGKRDDKLSSLYTIKEGVCE